MRVRYRVARPSRSLSILIALVATACGQSTRTDSGDAREETTGGQSGAATGGTSSAAGSSGAGAVNTGGSNAGGSSIGTGGSTAGSGGAPATVDVSGEWAMFGFEDPVAVSLQQEGATLTGTGCCAGLESDACCGRITGGSIVDRHARFAFPVETIAVYQADVFVAKDGSRMAGPFHGVSNWVPPTAWLRIPPGEPWLPETGGELAEVLGQRAGRFSIALKDTSPVAGFLPDTEYSFLLSVYSTTTLLAGDLGAFWTSELSWNEAERTLRAGPVPETHPELPTELFLRFDDTLLLELEATFASGETALFEATPQ